MIAHMLNDVIRREIARELARCEHKRQAVPEALKIVQRHMGYVSDESLAGLAEALDMSVDEIDSVATFYNLIYRRPVGRHVILVCDSVSCWITGYEHVLAHLKSTLGVELGQTTRDGRFTLLPSVCLGACDLAPAMMIDNDLHGPLTPEKIDTVLAKYA